MSQAINKWSLTPAASRREAGRRRLGGVSGSPPIRPAHEADLDSVAALWLASRRTAGTAIPATIHTDDEVRDWFRDLVFPTAEVWLIGAHLKPEAMMVLSGPSVDQLYVAPGHQRQGHGSRLIRFAQQRRDALSLWTFEANHTARRFYEKLGFAPVGPASRENEEGEPALLYRWTKS